jgi:hypothetical protein
MTPSIAATLSGHLPPHPPDRSSAAPQSARSAAGAFPVPEGLSPIALTLSAILTPPRWPLCDDVRALPVVGPDGQLLANPTALMCAIKRQSTATHATVLRGDMIAAGAYGLALCAGVGDVRAILARAEIVHDLLTSLASGHGYATAASLLAALDVARQPPRALRMRPATRARLASAEACAGSPAHPCVYLATKDARMRRGASTGRSASRARARRRACTRRAGRPASVS